MLYWYLETGKRKIKEATTTFYLKYVRWKGQYVIWRKNKSSWCSAVAGKKGMNSPTWPDRSESSSAISAASVQQSLVMRPFHCSLLDDPGQPGGIRSPHYSGPVHTSAFPTIRSLYSRCGTAWRIIYFMLHCTLPMMHGAVMLLI